MLLLSAPLWSAADCVPAPPGVLGWWPGEGSALDTMGLNSGAGQNGVVYGPGLAGQAFVFNGTNSYINVPDSPILSPHVGAQGELTLEAWVFAPRIPRFDSPTAQANRAIVVKGGPGQWEYGIYITTNMQPAFGVWQSSGYGYAGASGPTITTNQWHHLAGVLRKGQFARLYIDGQLAAESTSFSGDTSDGSSPLYIGCRGDGQYFDGSVDEVTLYGRALSSSEIAGIFSAGSSGKCANFTGAGVPYAADFANGAGLEWTLPYTDSSETLGFTRFLGRFGNENQTLTVTNLIPGQSYTVGFDFYAIDTWDGNSGNGDMFNVSVNGVPAFQYTFSNYNGNPPNVPQSYPWLPDEGRANYGFNPSWVDAIYRNIEVTFTASNSVELISFAGRNLEAIDNESWGIDNVSVRLAADLTNTFVRTTTLPANGGSTSLPIESFSISANWPLPAASATNASNYSLRLPGVDGAFNTGDDVIVPFAISLPGAGGRSVLFSLTDAPLQAGHYQFRASGLHGTNGSVVPDFIRDFYVANPNGGVIEAANSSSLATATALPLSESPAASGFFSALAVGTFSTTGDVDYWRFDAEAGDLITVRMEAESLGVYPQLRLRNSSDQDIASNGGDYYGVAQIQNYTINTPGTYYLRVWSDNNRSRYSFRLDVSRRSNGPQLESENNDSQGAANALAMTISPGLYQARVAGSLPQADSAGDYYVIGTMNPGNSVNVTALYPSASTLVSNQPVLSIELAGNSVPLAGNSSGNLNFTVVSNGVHYIHVTSANRGLQAQYLLNIAVSDGVPPIVTSTTLPAEGSTISTIVSQFNVVYSEDLMALSVTNNANYELRCAGADGLFGTSDDVLYTVTIGPGGYSSGLTANYAITDGPMQPGNYQFTISTNVQDRAGNRMAASFVQRFTVSNVPGFVLENRNSDSQGTGTPITYTPVTNADGTISPLETIGTPGNPRYVVAGRFTGGTYPDLVTANWGSGNITVFTNDGKGFYQTYTNLPTGANPISLATGDFNGDGVPDLAVANYSAGTVTVFLTQPNGVFQLVTNLGGFSQPMNIAVADLNGDGKADLVVPNNSSGQVSVFLGNGNGTFQFQSNYNTAGNPFTVAIGDLNHDGRPDLVISDTYYSKLSVLTNTGAGAFQLATNISVGPSPRFVSIGDVDGDGIPDLVSLQSGDNTFSILIGNGDGSFKPRRTYASGTTDAYQCWVADMDGGGRKDLVIGGFGNSQIVIFYNDPSGNFTNSASFGSSYPIGMAVGDFNGDGRMDVASVSYYNNYLTIWSGNVVMPLAENPPGSGLRSAAVRGSRANSGDVDFYRFSGNAGDQALVAIDVPGNPSGSSLYFQVQNPDGGVLTSFYTDGRGWGQSGVLTLPNSGTYVVRVAANNDYQGEYQIRVTLARPPLQLESENNSSISQADGLPFTRSGNRLQASVAGYIGYGDGGDFYNLGWLPAGSLVTLGVREPSTSGLAELLTVYNSSGTAMTNSIAGATNFTFTVPAGQDGAYYVAVTAAAAGIYGGADAVVALYNGNDSVNLGNWFSNQTFTISMWVNPSSSQPWYANIIDNNHTGNANWTFEQAGGSVNQYTWGVADGGAGIPFSLTPNVWQHLAVTRDATNVNSLYINGVLIGTSVGSGQINYNGSQTLRIGDWVPGGRSWNGMIDDVRMWGRPLSASEIVAGMIAPLTGNEPDLLGYWPFDEGFGSVAYDKSPLKHDASLVNASWGFVGSTNAAAPGLSSQYILSLDLSNSAPPQITSVSLPNASSTTSNLITSFTVGFSETMDPAFTYLTRKVYRYNGRSYLLTDASLNWFDAESAAVALGGHLTAISSSAQNAWINQTFSGGNNLWIGLSQKNGRENMAWLSGDPLTFSNWSGGEPNNGGGFEQAVEMYNNGTWADVTPYSSLRGVVEVVSTNDLDSDGLVDSIDPYPSDAYNAFDLRAAGPDGIFDTADDLVYHIYSTGYSSGLSTSFNITDGPLQPGAYRFLATSALKDRFGNSLSAPYVRYFTNIAVNGFISENRRGAGGSSSTSLSLNPGTQSDASFTAASAVGAQNNPYYIAQGDFNGDGYLDLVVANYSSGTISLLTNDHTGQFQNATNIATGAGTISVDVRDYNGDGHLDLAVANYNSGTVTILLGNGAGLFATFTNLSGFSQPRNLVSGDFNRDGIPDLAVPNENAARITVLFGTGDGNFTNSTNYAVNGGPETVRAADLNGDGNLDLVLVSYNNSTMTVMLGSTNGAFTVSTNFSVSANPHYVALGDVNGDGKVDAVLVNEGSLMSVCLGNGDGTFGPRTDYNLNTSSTYQVALADINNDGKLDVVAAGYGNSRVATLLNNGDGTFASQIDYSLGGNPISVTVGDFNHDGRLDLATANYYGANTTILLGNPVQGLTLDPATGIHTAAARGNLADSSDYDYWTFSAVVGDRIAIAAENPGDPGSSQLLYRIYYPDGSQWTYFYTDGNGRGDLSLIAPVSGTFTVRVEQSNGYTGEYRLRVSIAKAPIQLETENNGSIGSANAVVYSLTNGQRTATMLGYLGNADGGADFYQLGNLAGGTQITLNWARPVYSQLACVLEIYNSSGTLVAAALPTQTNLVYTVGAANGGAYYAHVTSTFASRSSAITNGLYFNANSTYVNVGSWSPGTQWSVQGWASPAWLPSGRHTIAGSAGGCLDWGIIMQDGRFAVNARLNGCNVIYAAPFVAVPNTFYHLAATCDGTNATLYVNGSAAASGPVDVNYTAYGGGTWIGGEVCCGDWFPGIIQDVSIWNRPLSGVEVSGFVSASPTGAESGLLGLWRLLEGSGTTVPDLSTNGHTGTLVNGLQWIPLAPPGSLSSGILQQYLLSINLLNTIPPQIVAVTLPDEGTASSAILDRFSVTFSEDMDPATVTNSANYELRGAGPDNMFGTADDQIYTVLNSPAYASGTGASYLLPDGPIQQGLVRFTIKTTVTDPVGTLLPAPYVRNFTVTNVPGYLTEKRFDNTWGQATSLAFNRTNRPDGSFTTGASVGFSGTAVERMAAGRIDADTNMDIVAALWQAGGVAVLLGNGDGTFRVKTNYSTGYQAFSVALGKFNGDTNLDLAVANYGANNVTVLMGNGDGTFQTSSNYAVGSQPYHITVADVNGDGKMDLIVPNYGSGNVSVLLGNGDGTFQPRVNYSVGRNPVYVAAADINGDGKPDLFVANYGDNNVSLLFGNGDGTFATPVGIAAGAQPRALVLADLNGDGKLDLAVFNGGDNTVSVMFGNGDGSFQPRVNYAAGTSDGYDMVAADFNGDGKLDLAVSGYYNNAANILANRGDGTFGSPAYYSIGRAVGLAAADFNNDGKMDLAAGSDSADNVTVFLGNDTQLLATDAATGLRIAGGRGNLYNSSQSDYWSFDASAGDVFVLATEVPGNPGGSALSFNVYRPDGNQLTSFSSDYYGRGQVVAACPVSGTYQIRVSPYYNYFGEYRFRVTLAHPPTQVESENNDSPNNADSLSYTLNGGSRQATVLGYIGNGDGSDFYRLGILSDGATINLSMAEPSSSGLLNVLAVYGPAQTVVGFSPAGATDFTYTVPPGAGGNYYASVWDAGPSAALNLGGVNGYALRMWGGSEYVSFTNSVIPTSGDYTVECWAYATSSSGYREIISQGTGGNAFYLGTDGSNIRCGDNWQNTGVSYPFYGWHHFAVVKSSTNTLLYVDGVLAATDASPISNPAAGAPFRIGRQYGGYTEYWPGYIDEVRVWNVARSAAIIQSNMTSRLTGSEPGLVGNWHFDEGAGTSVMDSSPSGNNGTLQGAVVWVPTRSNVAAPSIFSQYLLGLNIADSTGPTITGVTLPGAGAVNSGIVDRFTINFSKDVDPALNALNRDIRVFNGSAYTVTGGYASWYDAQNQARALGGYLATINGAAENGWVNTNFSGYGNLWLGLTDEAQKGTFAWASGAAFSYTNWDSNQPDNSANQDYTYMRTSGRWAALQNGNGGIYGLIEVSGPDSDGDGIPDTLDPYPNDPYNGFDLRAAGPDGLFDTADDDIYHLTHSTYTSGQSIDFSVTDGPLQPGNYRFMVTSSFRDLFGNGLFTPFVQYFSITNLPGFVLETRRNNSAASATPLPLVEDPPGVKSVGARGNLSTSSDVDYYSFSGVAGDTVNLATYIPGSPGGSTLHYQVLRPDGGTIMDFYPSYYGDGQTAPFTLPVTGSYTIAVSAYYGYQGEYRISLTEVTPPLRMETEPNDSIGTGNVLVFTNGPTGQSASVVGRVRLNADLDYYNLGTITNGSSIFLNVRLPGSSGLAPIVSVYNAAGVYQPETSGGRPNDGVANVPITSTGTYYALVRAGVSGDLTDQYVLDVNVVPTGSVNFPNLVVSAINTPGGSGIMSGQPIVYSFGVANIGNVATAAGNWIDRAVLSADTTLGNGDDIPLGFFPHAGALNPGDSYFDTNQFTLPDGISGDYYIIVQTDAGNAVNEYLFKGDNITVSSNTFHINVAPYPDLRVENLNVTGPDNSGTYGITWNTANRGNGVVPASFYERLVVRNQTAGTLILNSEQLITNLLAADSVLAHSASVVATNPGTYLVQVTTDSRDGIFEFNTNGHASAEANNIGTNGFQIVAYFNVALQSVPPDAGLLVGGGTYTSGSAVTVLATPITNTLPYIFVNWTEQGSFQSASTNYSFIAQRDRSLTANFTLPTYLISASNRPAGGGVVSGQGTYFYGVTNVLTASPNLGYRFTNWTENGIVIGVYPSLTNIVYSNRLVVANYAEANTFHVVGTGTTPSNVANVAGSGTYTNGQSVTISAPLSVTNPPNIYNFRQFQLNGSVVGSSASFLKTFTTQDPTNMQFTAVYDTVSILPLIAGTSINYPGRVPATTNFLLSIQFNRSMDTNYAPLILITNLGAAVQAVVPNGGFWSATAAANDTFNLPPVTFSTGMDGANSVWVSLARDLNGGQLALTNAINLAVDVTPPVNPTPSLVASNSSSATIDWSGYSAPSDISSFRVYVSTNSFVSVTGLTAVSSLASSSRQFAIYGLSLDKPYYAAVAAVDTAGNSSPVVTSLAFILPSSVPPPVMVQVQPVGASSASVSWNSYNVNNLLGFAGFNLYYETNNFGSVAGHAVRQAFGTGTRSVQIDNLDRTQTYYFAVVGFNVNNATNPNVTTASWSDPYAGQISANVTLGGAGQGTVDILQSITVVSNAVLTIPAGTTLRFAPGTGLTVQQGAVIANGTPLDPIVFTSANDQSGLTASAGDWAGITLAGGAGGSVLRNCFVKYGAGLVVTNASPIVDAFTATFNTPAGLTVAGAATLNTTNALLSLNDTGARQLGAARLTIINSVIKNNGTNALAVGGLSLQANQVWWGTANPLDIDAKLQGAIDRTGALSGEPLLTPAIGSVNNVTQVGSQSVNLRLACRTADSMRLSEDSTFTAVFFNTFTNLTVFPLSSGGGVKTIFAQFRSVTGQTSAPIAFSVTYITAGPTLSFFNLTEGAVLNRPLLVTGSASAPLGMSAMEFYVDNVGQATNAGGVFSYWFDIRNLASGIHRVKLLARDTSGNFATLQANVVIAPTPPPAPILNQPAGDIVINSNTVNVIGSAEPYLQVQLFDSGSLVGTTNASASGVFTFNPVVLNEGANQLVARAVDSLGSANSGPRTVTLDTLPPAQLIMDPAVYKPGIGLGLAWHFPTTGKRASQFVVFWSPVPINDPTNAMGSTLPLSGTSTTVQGLASGNYYFYVIGYDAIGNRSPISAPVSVTYDAIPPSFNIAFNKASPVGVGTLHVVLSASKALNGNPSLTVQPSGSSPSLLTLSNTVLNTYEGDINVTTLLPSGPVQFRVSATDLAGNPFNGAPSGLGMVIDVTPPSGYVSTAQPAPIQTTNTTPIAVSLQLTEAPQPGTAPVLNFAPPTGASVPLTLSGAGTNWNGTLTLTPSMGSGFGHFIMTVNDSLGNVGHSIVTGSALEIYNTALPSAPVQPVNFHAVSLVGGRVQLDWNPVDSAEIYRVYSEPGSTFVVPTFLVADNIVSNRYVDLPAADGSFRYVVTASRRGSEGVPSIVRVAVSDRTPPPTPTNVSVQLAASGLQIAWQAGSGEVADHYNIYRNGIRIGTVGYVSTVIDYPPRGIMSYTVAAADSLGNEATSAPVVFQTLVGAVGNLQALVTPGSSPVLTWVSTDSSAVGFNVYRNGIKQNVSAIPNPTFTDSLPIGNDVASYSVTAVNSTNAESAARSINVSPVDLSLLVNSPDGVSMGAPIASYFDKYSVGISNLAVLTPLSLAQIEVRRTAPGVTPVDVVTPVNASVNSNSTYATVISVPSASVSSQSVLVRATQQSDSAGSSVIYQKTFNLADVQTPGLAVEIAPNQLPLAGGLTPFTVKVYNRSLVPVYLATTRNSGANPGDVYIAVKNPQGQEVSRTPFNGTQGVIFFGDAGYLKIPAGGSTSFTVPSVFVPEALASNVVTFVAVASAIYDNPAAANPNVSGPLSGTTTSTLTQTPYFGTAQTDFSLYSGDQPIDITGQAIDRVSGLPLPNTALKIGFATRGYVWYVNVTTDGSGNYAYAYTPAPGFAGSLSLWAAHPLVFDQLNQAQVTIYRVYASPQGSDVRMSVNDTLPFTISLLNPGDRELTGFTVTADAYQMQGTNQVAISTVHGSLLGAPNFSIAAGQRYTVTLNLAADASAPSNAIVVFKLKSAEGAAATFTASIDLLPAIPVLSVVQPDIGYVEVSLDRGTLLSRQVTVVNRGLKDLQGVSILPPTNVTWMVLNLPAASDGSIPLPDIPVGATNSFTVVFTPPTNTDLGFFQDKLTIRGTNAQATFDVNLYARVTSSSHGDVQFYVDDILGLDVPNATVRLRNTDLAIELPPVQTDINGLVTVTNLQEGTWSWQIGASGHSANVGVVQIIPSQIVNVSTRLNKSVVTVNFSVVPVPFTDRYEIQIEQTFETHVPLPVLVMTPSFKEFDNVTPGFQASYIVTVKNEGLIQMENLTITGQTTASSSYTPLITYMPVLLPQQTVDVPFTVTYSGTNAPTQQGLGDALSGCLPDPSSIGSDIAPFIDGLRAIANAEGRCIKDNTLLAIAGGVAIGMKLYQDISGLFASIPEQIASYIGCVIGTLLGQGLDGGGGGSGGGQGSSQGFAPTGAGCFAPDTQVLLYNGESKRIDRIVAGDIVRSGTDARSLATVAETRHLKADVYRVITFDQAHPTTLLATEEHLFWVDGAGWVAASQLRVGEWLLTSDGDRVQVTANKRTRDSREVYTLKLRDDTAFYANGVLVHDLCGALGPPLILGQSGASAITNTVNLSK